MKISKIEQNKAGDIFTVTFTPNFFERLVGIKTKIKKYKDSGSVYAITNETSYTDENGKRLGCFDKIVDSINNWRRSF
jgi:hypothetical protein